MRLLPARASSRHPSLFANSSTARSPGCRKLSQAQREAAERAGSGSVPNRDRQGRWGNHPEDQRQVVPSSPGGASPGWQAAEEVTLCQSRSRAVIADSGSCRFHHSAKHQLPQTPHRSSTRQRRRWLNLAAIMAQFLTATAVAFSRLLAVTLPGLSTVAISRLIGDSSTHSKTFIAWNSEDVFAPPLFQNPQQILSFF